MTSFVRSSLLALTVACLATPLLAAPPDSTSTVKTIFGNEPFTSGGFGAPVLKVTAIDGQTSLFVGGRGGWVINKTFVIGGGGYGLVTHTPVSGLPSTSLQVGYGGGELEYIFASDEAIHASLMMLIGAGGAQMHADSLGGGMNNWERGNLASTTFFVFEPQVNVELNLTRWFRIGAGVSYRYTNGASMTVQQATINDVSLRGVAGVLTLKFGVY